MGRPQFQQGTPGAVSLKAPHSQTFASQQAGSPPDGAGSSLVSGRTSVPGRSLSTVGPYAAAPDGTTPGRSNAPGNPRGIAAFDQALASAAAFSLANSSAVIAPESSNCLAAAISEAGPVPATSRT